MKYTSYIELDQNALHKNIKYLQQELGSYVRFVSVIKGNAYGHGISEFVPMAEYCGIDYFAVFDVLEAQQACKVKKEGTDIMIMGGIEPENLLWVIENNCSFFISDLEGLKQAIRIAQQLEKKAKIHLEIETGLHRTGLEEESLSLVVDLLKDYQDFLEIEGICTHFDGAESIANYIRVHDQFDRFQRIKDELESMNITANYYHVACSSAALMYPETRLNMVRIGIVQFGFWPSKETKIHKMLSDKAKYKRNPLKRVLTWKSKVMGVKTVDTGDFIGYGISYQATKKTRIATVPVGYYHGYRRSLSNIGDVLIHGKKASIIGFVNMSIMIVDISNIVGVKKWDEVVLIGKQGRAEITVASFSEQLNLVNYELLVRLPLQIPRVVIEHKRKLI
jgi:alanine racemase